MDTQYERNTEAIPEGDQIRIDLTQLAQIGDLARAVEMSIAQVALSVSTAYGIDAPSQIPESVRRGIAQILRAATNLERITHRNAARLF